MEKAPSSWPMRPRWLIGLPAVVGGEAVDELNVTCLFVDLNVYALHM